MASPAMAAYNEVIPVPGHSCPVGQDVIYRFRLNMSSFQVRMFFQVSELSSSGPWTTINQFQNISGSPGQYVNVDTNYRFTNIFYNNRVEFFSGSSLVTGVRDIATYVGKSCGA